MASERILIVEDDPDWLGILRQHAVNAVPTAEVIPITSIAAAWPMVTAHSPPDLLITDIMWKRIATSEDQQEPKGRHLAQEARARNVPVIAITWDPPAQLFRALFVRDRLNDVFLKTDFERDEFIRRVREILREQLAGSPAMQQRVRDWLGVAQRQMLAVVFTDIVGSTKLLRRIGDAPWKELIERHYHQGRSLIAAHGGHEIQTIGDAFMVVFPTAVEALDFCLAFHAATGADEIKIRTGCHIGAVEVSGQNILGGMIHLLSRVMKCIAGPEVWFTGDARNQVDQVNDPRHNGLIWTEHPGCDLREFGPQRLWSVRR